MCKKISFQGRKVGTKFFIIKTIVTKFITLASEF